MIVSQSLYAVAPSIKASFLATGGVEPYLYEVLPDGAGGSIDPATGAYQAPTVWNPDPARSYDRILVTDYDGETAEARILVGSPLMLFCEIIQRELGLPQGRVWLYSQKKPAPSDQSLFVSVAVERLRFYGSSNRHLTEGANLNSDQYAPHQATLGVMIESRSTEALNRYGEVTLALTSDYSQRQQAANSFGIARLPISPVQSRPRADGAAIPYQFYFSINVNFVAAKNAPIEYYDNFEDPYILIDP